MRRESRAAGDHGVTADKAVAQGDAEAMPMGLGTLAYEEVLTAYAAVSDLIVRKAELADVLVAVTRQSRALLGVRRCALYLPSGDDGRFRGEAAVVEGDREDDSIKRLVCGGASDGFTREILETGRPVLVRDATKDPRPVRAAVRTWGVCSILGVPLIAQGEVIGLLFLDDTDGYHQFRPGDEHVAAMFASLAAPAIAQAQRVHALSSTAVHAVRQNELLRRANALEERLTTLALGASNVQEMVQAVSTVIGEPCALHDAEHRRIAAVATDDAELISVLDPDIAEPVRVAVLEAMASGKPALVGPFPKDGLHRRFVVAPVRVGDQTFGHLVIVERFRRLGPLDLGIARHAVGIVALGFASRDRAERVGVYARQALVRDLLAGTADTSGLAERAEQCGVDLDRSHAVALLRCEARPLAVEKVEQAVRAAGAAAPAFAVAQDEHTVALLLPSSGGGGTRATASSEARATVERIVDQLASDGADLGVALSSACDVAAEGAAALAEAEQVLRCLHTVRAPTGTSVLSADELGAGRLILASLNRAEAQRFVKQTLGALVDGDGRGGDLLGTLGVFFDCCRSVRQAALEMDVHENTIRYRLARVAEVTGLDLASNPDDQLSGQLAVLILRLQGQLPRLAAADAEADVPATDVTAADVPAVDVPAAQDGDVEGVLLSA